VDDAIEFRDDGERPTGGGLTRREAAGAEEEESRKHPTPHVEIVMVVMGSDPGDVSYGVRPR